MHPQVLILDEATAMLDPSGRREVLDTVFRLRKEMGMTVIMITQLMEEAARCDRVLVMSEGKLAMEGTPSEIFAEREMLRSCGLDTPIPVRLALDLKEVGMPIGGLPLNEKQVTEEICRSLSAS